jgi:hypothetical protein
VAGFNRYNTGKDDDIFWLMIFLFKRVLISVLKANNSGQLLEVVISKQPNKRGINSGEPYCGMSTESWNSLT